MITSVHTPGKVLIRKKLIAEIQQIMKENTGKDSSINEAIILASDSYLHDLKLNQNQKNKIEQAATSAKMTPMQIMDKACEWAFRFYSKKYSTDLNRNLKGTSSGSVKDNEFYPGSAYERIDAFVKKIIKKNDQAKKKQDKVFINQTFLAKNQGSNRDAIKGYLHVQKELLDKHHQEHDLNQGHNIQVNSHLKSKK